MQLQLVLPVWVSGRHVRVGWRGAVRARVPEEIGEGVIRLRAAFGHQLALDVREPRSPAAHGLVAWELRDGHVQLVLAVELSKLVNTDEVEGIDASAPGRVGRMVGVEERTFVVDDGSRCRTASGVSVAVLRARREVDVRQELCDGRGHIVGAAE